MQRTQLFCMGYFIIAMLTIAFWLVPDWVSADHRLFGIWTMDFPSFLLTVFSAIILFLGAYYSESVARFSLYLLGGLTIANTCGVFFTGKYFSQSIAQYIFPSLVIGQNKAIDVATSFVIAGLMLLTAFILSGNLSSNKELTQ